MSRKASAKTPMAVISGYVQLLVNEPDQNEREAFAESIHRQVELINAMTRETIAFARGDSTLWVRKVYLHRFFARFSAAASSAASAASST